MRTRGVLGHCPIIRVGIHVFLFVKFWVWHVQEVAHIVMVRTPPTDTRALPKASREWRGSAWGCWRVEGWGSVRSCGPGKRRSSPTLYSSYAGIHVRPAHQRVWPLLTATFQRFPGAPCIRRPCILGDLCCCSHRLRRPSWRAPTRSPLQCACKRHRRGRAKDSRSRNW